MAMTANKNNVGFGNKIRSAPDASLRLARPGNSKSDSLNTKAFGPGDVDPWGTGGKSAECRLQTANAFGPGRVPGVRTARKFKGDSSS